MLLAAGTARVFACPANGVGQGQHLANGRVKVYSVLDAVIYSAIDSALFGSCIPRFHFVGVGDHPVLRLRGLILR